MRTKEDRLEEVGKCAYESIAEMVAALRCDYNRLEELRDERDGWVCEDNDGIGWQEASPDNADELKDLEASAGDCESEDQARERIQEDPLSLQVRSGWHYPSDESEAEEFELLLGTGGPAVRIIGELDRGEPSRPRLQVQDWGTPWTEYMDVDDDILLAYCQVFYFGE